MKRIFKGLGFVVLSTLLVVLSAIAFTQEGTIEIPSGDGQAQAEVRIFRASIVVDRRGIVHRQPVREVTYGDPFADQLKVFSPKGVLQKGDFYGETNIIFESNHARATGESTLLKNYDSWVRVCARVTRFAINGEVVNEPFPTCGPRKLAEHWVLADPRPTKPSGCLTVFFGGGPLDKKAVAKTRHTFDTGQKIVKGDSTVQIPYTCNIPVPADPITQD